MEKVVFNCLLLLLHMQCPGGHGLLNFQKLSSFTVNCICKISCENYAY